MARIVEMQKTVTKSDVIAYKIKELLLGRNVSTDAFNKYVVEIEQDGAALRVTVDDGTVYLVEVQKI